MKKFIVKFRCIFNEELKKIRSEDAIKLQDVNKELLNFNLNEKKVVKSAQSYIQQHQV